MTRPLPAWLLGLVFALLALAPASGQDVADLVARLEAEGARTVQVAPTDPRLRGGRITTGVGADGRVEVYLPHGEGLHRTPLVNPAERMPVETFRAMAEDMRRAVRQLYGIEVSRIYIAGSSSGIPFRDPNTGELRTFDRKGVGTSDYDGAMVSEELYRLVEEQRPRALRGTNTGKRTAPDPLPELRQAFEAISEKYGRHVAAMVYSSQAEFDKRMQLIGSTVGGNVMVEPGANARGVVLTRAEVLRALVEAEALRRLTASHGTSGATELIERARAGEAAAEAEVRAAKRAAVGHVSQSMTLGEVDTATLKHELARLQEPSNFAARRNGPRGPPARLLGSEAELRRTFGILREASLAQASERIGELPASERPAARAAIDRLRDTRLQVVESNARALEFNPETNSVRATTGLLNRVQALIGANPAETQLLRNKALGLLFGHELAHAAGIRAEAVADRQAVRTLQRASELTRAGGIERPLTRADLQRTVGLFGGEGSRLSNWLYALRNLPLHGTESSRVARMERAGAGEPDRLARYRRADGTLNWSRLTADKALHHGAGVAHFALALFLKELAVVVQTGDRARIDEFFDGLLTTDFYVHYGLFSVGAHAGNVAYSRFLSRYVKPGFVSGVLRTNVVLAAGLALPDLVRGHFEGGTFAINLAALGISSTAVQAGVRGISWVMNLDAARARGLLGTSARAARLARIGGWFYTAVETAVVLYFADEIAEGIHAYVEERDARNAVGDATLELQAALDGDDAAFAEHLAAFSDAHRSWRDRLLAPIASAEARYHERLARAAREAKLLADERRALLERVEDRPALRRSFELRYGSLEAFADARTSRDRERIEEDLRAAMESFEASRRAGLEAAYGSERRDDDYLSPGTPLSAAGSHSWWARRGLRSEARGVSENRLQAYEDEIAALEAAREAVLGDPEKLSRVDLALEVARETLRRDRELMVGDDGGLVGSLAR